MMRRAIARHAHWPADQRRASVTLAFDQRHRRRVMMEDDDGRPFLLDLTRAAHLADGDGLELDCGGFIAVIAAPEPVADLTAADPVALARLAWHVGNRHVPVQVLAQGALRVPDDPVLLDMASGLGARVTRKMAPFQPEPGAYDRDGADGGHHDPHHHHHHGGGDHSHQH